MAFYYKQTQTGGVWCAFGLYDNTDDFLSFSCFYHFFLLLFLVCPCLLSFFIAVFADARVVLMFVIFVFRSSAMSSLSVVSNYLLERQ